MLIVEEKAGASGGGSVGRRRRRWSEAQKRQIVAETHEPGVSVPMVAQRYKLNANQIFRWRRLFRESEDAAGAGRFVPVVVEGVPGREAGAAAMRPQSDDDVAVGAPAPWADGDRAGGGSPGDRRPGGRRGGAVARDRGAGAAMIPVPSGGSGVACDRGDGHAPRHEHAGAAGPAGPRARSPCGGSLCLPRTQRRPFEDSLARRYRDIALCQASGTGTVPLAVDGGRRGIDQRGATRLPAGGDRVAQSGADLAAVAGGLAESRAPATVRRYVASIAAAHREIGRGKTLKSAPVKLALRRMHRRQGAPPGAGARADGREVDLARTALADALQTGRDGARRGSPRLWRPWWTGRATRSSRAAGCTPC